MTILCQECGAPAVVVSPGTPETRLDLFDIMTVRPVPDRAWCWPCAIAAGWPWVVSERPRGARNGCRKPRRRKGELFGAGERLAERP